MLGAQSSGSGGRPGNGVLTLPWPSSSFLDRTEGLGSPAQHCLPAGALGARAESETGSGLGQPCVLIQLSGWWPREPLSIQR